MLGKNNTNTNKVNASQVSADTVTVSSALKVGEGGTTVTQLRPILIKFNGTTGLWSVLLGNAGDNLSGAGNAAITMSGYATVRQSINFFFGAPLASANYHVLVGTSTLVGDIVRSYRVVITTKTNASFRMHLIREDASTFDATDVYVSLSIVI